MNNTLNACEDCEILCDTSLEDQLAYLNNNRCASCEAKMLKEMEEERENDKENFFEDMQEFIKEKTGMTIPMECIIRDYAKYYCKR